MSRRRRTRRAGRPMVARAAALAAVLAGALAAAPALAAPAGPAAALGPAFPGAATAPALAAQDRGGDPPADTLRADSLEAGDARAPQEAGPPAYRGEEILVRIARGSRALSRLPAAVSALDAAEELSADRATSLADLLSGVPGVFAQDRRNVALGDRLAVRGAGARAQFGVRGVRVLADGIPLTMPDGQTALGNLDLLSAGRVEVLRGPASTLYGNAAGGVVSVTTRPPPPSPAVAARLTAGSHGLVQTRMSGGGRLGDAGLLLAGERLRTEGFRRHAEAEVWRGSALLETPLARGALRAVGSVYHTPFAENPGSLDRETARLDPRAARDFLVAQGTGESATQAQAGLTLDRPLGEAAALTLSAWGSGRDLTNPIPDRVIRLDRLAGGARAELGVDGTLAGRDVRWTSGLDVETQRDDRRERENLGVPASGRRTEAGELLLDQEESVLGLGAFGRGEVELGRSWRGSAAARLDVYRFRARDRLLADGDDSGRRTFVRVSPSAGLSRALGERATAWARLATGFQTPTTSELSNRPDGAGGFHPDLAPEKTLSAEAGLRAGLPEAGLEGSLSAYAARVRDALVPFEGATEEVFFRNAGEVERLGLELSLGWAPLPRLRTELAWTAQRARFVRFETGAEDFAGNAEPGVPGQRVSTSAVYRGPSGGRFEAAFRWVDGYAVDDANTAWNPSYRVVDLRVAFERGPVWLPLRPFLAVENVFDERYNGSVVPNAFGERYYEPAPGREVLVGGELRLGPDAGAP